MSGADDRIVDESFAQRLADMREAGKRAVGRLEQLTEMQQQPLEPPVGKGMKGWLKRLIFRAVSPTLQAALDTQAQQQRTAVSAIADMLKRLGDELDRLSADLHRSYIKSGEAAGALRHDLIRHTDTAVHNQSEQSARAAREKFQQELAAIRNSMRAEVETFAADLGARADLLIEHVQRRLEMSEHDLRRDLQACDEQLKALQLQAAELHSGRYQSAEITVADTPIDQSEKQIFSAFAAEKAPALAVGRWLVDLLEDRDGPEFVRTAASLDEAAAVEAPSNGWRSIMIDAFSLQTGRNSQIELLLELLQKLETGGLVCARMPDPAAMISGSLTRQSDPSSEISRRLAAILGHSDSFSVERTIVLQRPETGLIGELSLRSGLSRSTETIVGDLNNRIGQLNRLLFGYGTVALVARKL